MLILLPSFHSFLCNFSEVIAKNKSRYFVISVNSLLLPLLS